MWFLSGVFSEKDGTRVRIHLICCNSREWYSLTGIDPEPSNCRMECDKQQIGRSFSFQFFGKAPGRVKPFGSPDQPSSCFWSSVAQCLFDSERLLIGYGSFSSFASVRLASLTISVIILVWSIELVIMCYVDPYELLVRTVRYCIFMYVEVFDKGIPLVWHL